MAEESAVRWWRRIQWRAFLLGAVIVACSFYVMAIGNGHAVPCPGAIRDFLEENTVVGRLPVELEPRGVVAAKYGLFIGGGFVLISLILFVPPWFNTLFHWTSEFGGRDPWRK